jgi:hypothetical protein
MGDITFVIALIGAISGITSLAGMIYAIGYKMGRIDEKLENISSYILRHLDPEKQGEKYGRVDALWQFFNDMITALMVKKIRSPATQVFRSIFETLGVEVRDIKIFKVIVSPKDSILRPISKLSEISPDTYLLLTAELGIEGREFEYEVSFYFDKYRKTVVENWSIDCIKFKNEDAKMDKKTLALYIKGYTEAMTTLINNVLTKISSGKARRKTTKQK